ncbi:hypothetical protein BL253_25390 [Pseudofrankia asymbiotica]|uniref:Uncharacterized protein n=1 Tax=Pseudofrankia asymbiotica TaxID=1834516 RepID=A0A1V2I546_9ACTN|nr:hypothetical protein BL253_25390 [Pseudofrankia asymbiotica]
MTALAGCVGDEQPGSQRAATTPAAATTTTVPAAATPTDPGRSGSPGTLDDPVTRRVNLAPVDRRGQATTGWTIDGSDDDPSSPIDCGDTSRVSPSPAAVSGDIYYCSPSAAGADACWPTPQAQRMLCLRDPFTTTLDALTAQALVAKVSPPKDPAPLGLLLANGDHCRLRDGGAWSSPEGHPDYVGSYSCGPHGDVWAPQNSSTGGINKTVNRWTVLVGDITGPLTTVPVAEAYYVATAP